MVSPAQIFLFLFAGIAAIIFLTVKLRMHAFFALLLACFFVGLGMELSFSQVITAVREGFGNILKSLGLIIILGTLLGVLLEHTGSTRVMADFIMRKTGRRYPALAMSITGFIVGLPVFCDSGYIVLNGLARSMAKKTNTSLAIISVSLSTGLYAVHCLVPPHPGITATVTAIGSDLGKQILLGITVAIPVMLVGYCWALYAGRKEKEIFFEEEEPDAVKKLPGTWQAFLPMIIPVFLIGMRSVALINFRASGMMKDMLDILGEPAVALAAGIIFCLLVNVPWKKAVVTELMHDSVEKAGSILVIIGAGGAFGAVLAAAKIGSYISHPAALAQLGIVFPFLITAILKTSLGSSTVAIITASSIIQPLLPVLGIDTESGKLLCVLAMGGGSMMISHANDAYFWVISRFTPLEMRPMLRVYSVASLLMGITTLVFAWILSFFL